MKDILAQIGHALTPKETKLRHLAQEAMTESAFACRRVEEALSVNLPTDYRMVFAQALLLQKLTSHIPAWGQDHSNDRRPILTNVPAIIEASLKAQKDPINGPNTVVTRIVDSTIFSIRTTDPKCIESYEVMGERGRVGPLSEVISEASFSYGIRKDSVLPIRAAFEKLEKSYPAPNAEPLPDVPSIPRRLESGAEATASGRTQVK